MAQETKAKSEGDQVRRTIYGEGNQAQGTIYGQDSQTRPDQGQPQRVTRQPQGAPYGQGGQAPQQRAAGGQPGAPYSQVRRTVYGQDEQGRPDQRQIQRIVRQPQGGQMPAQRMSGQPQSAQGSRTAYRQPDGRMRPDQRQPQRTARQPYAPGSQMSSPVPGSRPQGQRVPRGQARGAVYDQNGRPQGRVPYSQGGRVPSGGQMGDPDRPQGTMVRKRDGYAPGYAPVRSGLSGRQLMEQSKKMFRSPVFLLIAALCTVFTVTTIASVLLQDLSFSQVVNILANFDAPSELMAYANRILSFISKLGSGMIVVSLLLHLPEFLLCVGFWMLFITAGSSRDPMPGTGFLCTKIYIIIKMIIMCIVMLICLIMSVVFTVSAWMSDILQAKILSAVFLAAMVVITMMVIMYFFCLLHTVKVCRANAIQGDNFSSVSRYAAVLTIFAALCSVIGLLSAIVNSETAGIVSFACKIGWMVLAGLWILMYRSKIKVPGAD